MDEGRGSWSSSPRHPALMGLALHWTSAYLALRASTLYNLVCVVPNPFVVQQLYIRTSARLSCPQISPPRAARRRAGKSPWICNSIVSTNSCQRQQTNLGGLLTHIPDDSFGKTIDSCRHCLPCATFRGRIRVCRSELFMDFYRI